MAFYEVEPFGEGRADLRAGVVASTIANVNRGPSRQAYRPEDFVLFREPETVDDKIIAAFSKLGK